MTLKTEMRSERGSIPMALLGIIALTSVIGALVATTVGGTRTARFDQQYTEIIQVADAGAQAGAQYLLRGVSPTTLQNPATTTFTGNGTIDGIGYTWTAERQAQAQCRSTATVANCWRVTGAATSPGAAGVQPVTRRAALRVSDESRFFLAAFSDLAFRLRGGNAASSYNPTQGTYDLGNGVVGSNGTIRLNGNTYVDGVVLYNFTGATADFGRCDGRNIAGQCADLLAPGGPIARSGTRTERLDIGPGRILDTAFIDQKRTDPNFCPATLSDYRSSTSNPVGVIGTPNANTVLCVNNLNFDRDTVVATGGTVEVYVYGTVSVANSTRVNCASCGGANPVPMSSRLRIYSDGGGVNIGNHSDVAAAIYAPESDCGGNPSNAQAELYGSLICREITNQGGWGFHFDEDLLNQGSGNYQISTWTER